LLDGNTAELPLFPFHAVV